MLINKYNRLASTYHFLAFITYGHRLRTIQQRQLHHLPQSGDLLLLGGGDGSILPSIYQHAPHIRIDYLEASDAMIERARKNCPDRAAIRFIHDTVPPERSYDVIFAPFFLDQFSGTHLLKWRERMARLLRSDGMILVVDLYRATGWRQSWLVFWTILFFKWTVDYQPDRLPDVFDGWEQLGFKTLEDKYLSGELLRSSLLTRM